jgi:hypothetical protein
MNKLENMERTVNYIKEYIEDSRLTNEEKRLLDDALEERKQGKLLTSKDVFG